MSAEVEICVGMCGQGNEEFCINHCCESKCYTKVSICAFNVDHVNDRSRWNNVVVGTNRAMRHAKSTTVVTPTATQRWSMYICEVHHVNDRPRLNYVVRGMNRAMRHATSTTVATPTATPRWSTSTGSSMSPYSPCVPSRLGKSSSMITWYVTPSSQWTWQIWWTGFGVAVKTCICTCENIWQV